MRYIYSAQYSLKVPIYSAHIYKKVDFSRGAHILFVIPSKSEVGEMLPYTTRKSKKIYFTHGLKRTVIIKYYSCAYMCPDLIFSVMFQLEI